MKVMMDILEASCVRLIYHCPDMFMSSNLYIVGSCNGLMCLHGINRPQNYSDILLWNTCTGDSCVLPKHTHFFQSDPYVHPMFCGFGYDSTTEDYKVILGDSCVVCDDGWKCYTEVRLFTLKTGLWRNYHEERRMNNPDKLEYTKLAGQGCLSNGALHWMELVLNDRGCLDGSRIMSFDLAREKFQEMVSISSFVDKECLDRISAAYIIGKASAGIGSTTENSLLVYFYVASQTSDTRLIIWVMNEYGVKASWAKLLHITSTISIRKNNFDELGFGFPVSILENGEVLMSCNEQELVLYNPKEKTSKTVLVTNLSCEGIMYTETLISPVIGGGVDVCNQQGGEAEASETQIDYLATRCLNLDTWIVGNDPETPWKISTAGWHTYC